MKKTAVKLVNSTNVIQSPQAFPEKQHMIEEQHMISVGAYEAKTNLARLLDQVARGEQVTITRHGVPVARLMPVSQHEHLGREEAIARLQSLSQGLTLGGLSLQEMIREGRK